MRMLMTMLLMLMILQLRRDLVAHFYRVTIYYNMRDRSDN